MNKRASPTFSSVSARRKYDLWPDSEGRRLSSGWKVLAALMVAFLISLSCVGTYKQSVLRYFAFRAPAGMEGTEGPIQWTSCGDNLECGRLTVPLDYANASAGFASLSLVKYPASNKTARLGTLMTNPGGPGGSGVGFVTRGGALLNSLLGGRYDIVSWDPRGVNGTVPVVECFPSQTEQSIFYANTHQEILPDTRNLTDPIDFAIFEAGVNLGTARLAAEAQLCKERTGDALRYVGTAAVVRDLVRIYDALEGPDAPINYWGFSYGTIVGAYFVNMFPDRVGRVAIDGVADPVSWANKYSYEWARWSLPSIEETLQDFYDGCAAAGPERCALASDSSTAQSIADAVDGLLDKLYEHPLPVPHAKRPNALTASSVKTLIFTALYSPRIWGDLATSLAAALKGDGKPIIDTLFEPIELDTSKPPEDIWPANKAIECADALPLEGLTREEANENMLNEIVYAQTHLSRHFGALALGTCCDWTVRQAERFAGPFNHTLSNSILVVGNTADPVTSLENAVLVNDLLKNSSRLLVQDGPGHCSLAMASLCTITAIRAYFVEGTLPENGMKCPVDEVLFPPPSHSSDYGATAVAWLDSEYRALSQEEFDVLQDARALGQVLQPFTRMLRPLSAGVGL